MTGFSPEDRALFEAEATALFEGYGEWAGLVSWLEVWADWQRRAGRALP